MDWGVAFQEAHEQAYPNMEASSLYVALEDLAVRHLLTMGGVAYLSRQTAHPYLESQTFHRVTGAPAFKRPSYVVYSASPADEALLDRALEELKSLARAAPR